MRQLFVGSNVLVWASLLASFCCRAYEASRGPTVFPSATFQVKEQLAVQYAQGVLCSPKPCNPKTYDACQNPEPGSSGIAPSKGCPQPAKFNLTLDLYTPIGAESYGKRPAFVAMHSGGYSGNSERGFAPTYEMTAACKYFASRGFVAITMVYRLTNSQTGGALAPSNWSAVPTPLGKDWKGGFLVSPQVLYPAVRDSKAAIRWLRGHANELNIDPAFVAAGGWSAGALTTAFLASQFEWDFTTEMTSETDPTYSTLEPFLNVSSSIQAGVVWAGNGGVTDTKNALDKLQRFSKDNAPLAMYRGAKDGYMTPWAQQDLQTKFNQSGARCDLFAVPDVGHVDLFPTGKVATRNGVPIANPMPVLDHSYLWLSEAMNLNIPPSPPSPPGPSPSIVV